MQSIGYGASGVLATHENDMIVVLRYCYFICMYNLNSKPINLVGWLDPAIYTCTARQAMDELSHLPLCFA